MRRSRRWRRCAVVLALVVLSYPVAYGALRVSRYFVRQEFACFSCPTPLMQELEAKFPHAHQISVVSEATRIGCGRVQKKRTYFAESFLLSVFAPMAKLELGLRGFNSTTLYVHDNVTDAPSAEGVYVRTILLAELPVSFLHWRSDGPQSVRDAFEGKQ